MKITLPYILALSALLGCSLLASSAIAQVGDSVTTDIEEVRFYAGGDKTGPKCQVTYPSSATSDFFISWFCDDDVIDSENIITNVWILRQDAPRFVKVEEFLGFPASFEVTETVLGRPFETGLPISFKLEARDQAGNTTISEPFTIGGQDTTLDNCDLIMSTRATTAQQGSTGLPRLNVTANGIETFTQSINSTSFTIRAFQTVTANPCEIDGVCGESNELSFISTVSLEEASSGDRAATARLSLSPSGVEVQLRGNASISGQQLQSLRLSGVTLIDGLNTDVSIACQNR